MPYILSHDEYDTSTMCIEWYLVVFMGLWPFYVSATPYDIGLFSVR